MAVDEIHDFDFVVSRDHDGLGGEISMDNIGIVHDLECLDELPGDRFLCLKIDVLLASLRLT